MAKILKIELVKSVKSKRLIIFVAIMLFLSIFFGIVMRQIENTGMVTEEMMKTMRGGFFSMQILGLSADMVLPIFSTLFACFLVSDEYSNGTLKLPILCGHTRINVIVSKIFAVILMMFVILMVTWVCSNVVSAFIWGDEGVISMMAFSAMDYGKTFLALAAWSVMMITCSLYIQNSGILIGTMVAVLMVSSIIGNMFPSIAKYIITYYLKAFIGMKDVKEIMTGCIVCLITTVLFGILALVSFCKMEIQK